MSIKELGDKSQHCILLLLVMAFSKKTLKAIWKKKKKELKAFDFHLAGTW